VRRHEVCHIVRWRGYVTCEFYARGSVDGEIVAASGTFRWRKSAPPPNRGRPRAALDPLVAVLHADGWRECGRGPVWYERRLERVIVVPVAEAAIPAPVVRWNEMPPAAKRQHTAAAPSPPPAERQQPPAVPSPPRAGVPVVTRPLLEEEMSSKTSEAEAPVRPIRCRQLAAAAGDDGSGWYRSVRPFL
jgi:hypothetical protein